jgi:hypothetical protein
MPRPRAADLLVSVADRLAELAEQDLAHPFWWSPAGRLPPQLRSAFPGGAWNLGVAPGWDRLLLMS